MKTNQILSKAILMSSLTMAVSAAGAEISHISIQESSLIAVGSGCPAGSVYAYEMRHDEDVSLTIQYDQLYAATGPRARAARAACNVRIPVQIPRGQRLVLDYADTDGYADVDRGGKGAVASNVFIFASRARTETLAVSGPRSKSFSLESQPLETDCSGSSSGFLGLTIAASVQDSLSSAGSSVYVDQTSLRFHLESCR